MQPPSVWVRQAGVHHFYRFCGKIDSIEYDAAAKTAIIVFEKQQAAKTALMLNGGTLDGATIHVTSDEADEILERRTSIGGADEGYEQHDKPRAGIAAELLAKGYVLSENVLHKAIEIDQKQVNNSFFILDHKPTVHITTVLRNII